MTPARFTIAGAMLAVAGVAGICGIARVEPALAVYLAFSAASVGAGRWAWRICRPRPWVVPRLTWALVALGCSPVLVLGGTSQSWVIFLIAAMLFAPITIGSALAWFDAADVDLGDAGTDQFLQATVALSTLAALVGHAGAIFLVMAGSR